MSISFEQKECFNTYKENENEKNKNKCGNLRQIYARDLNTIHMVQYCYTYMNREYHSDTCLSIVTCW